MGRRGPKPTPTAVLQRRGSWRGKARGKEPRADRGIPACPFPKANAAYAIWQQVTELLDNMGILTVADGLALERYCRLFVRWRKAEAELASKNDQMVYAITDDAGTVKSIQQLPHVAIARTLSAELSRLEQQFGLTPSARAGLGMSPLAKVEDDAKAKKKQKSKERFFTH